MNNYQLFDSEWIQALGWTLLHSLWQGVLIALLLAIVLLIFRKQSANSRYLFGILALSGLLVSIVVTFALIYTPSMELVYTDLSPTVNSHAALSQVDNAALDLESYTVSSNTPSMISEVKSYFKKHMPLIMLFYLIGVLILTMRMLGELVYIQNLRYSRSQLVAKVWQQKLKAIATKMGIKKAIALKDSIHVNSPMTIGFLKPVIFVPMSLLANLPSDQIESILAHELAHIRRHDYLINLLQSFVEILLFFNPAVWWMSSFIRSEREHCCDDIAIGVTGDKLTFARTLANLEEWRIQNSRLAIALAGKNNGGVLGRVQRLLEKKESNQLPFRLFWGVMILSIGLVFTAFNMSEASIPEINNLVTSSESFSLDEDKMSEIVSPIQHEKELIAPLNIELNETPIETGIESGKVSKEQFQEMKLQETMSVIVPSDLKDTPDNPSALQVLPVRQDTVPQAIIQLKKEISVLKNDFQKQRAEIVKQMKELHSKRHAIENDVQKKNHELQSAQLKLQKEMQSIEKEKMMLEREVELQLNSQQEVILELQYQMQELELFLDMKQEELEENDNDEEIKKEIAEKRRAIQEVRKAILLQEKELNRKELEARKVALHKEREVQEILYKNQMQEHENQMNAHSKEGDLLKFEESAQVLEMKMSELEQKFQYKIQQLQQKMEMEHLKMEKEQY